MKLSDYVVQKLKENDVRDVFLLAGGGIMHLLDSVAREDAINKYYTLHEQGAGFAADGYAQCSNRLGVVFATTGPGATNVVTALGSAFIDSTPMLVLSGQVKTADMTTIGGVRQTGAQEIGIIPIVESITKYAVTVKEPARSAMKSKRQFTSPRMTDRVRRGSISHSMCSRRRSILPRLRAIHRLQRTRVRRMMSNMT